MTCLHCQRYQREIARLEAVLERESGLEKIGALQAALGLSLTEARITMQLYGHAATLSNWLLIDALGLATDQSLKVHVMRIRKALGMDAIQTLHRVGYRLTDAGRARVAALLNPKTEIAA